MPGASSPTPPAAKTFVLVAIVCGLAVTIAVLLWANAVITLPVLIGVIAVAVVVEIGAIIVLQRRASRHHAHTHEQATRGGASTLEADNYGYDPMAGGDGGPRP